MERCPKAPKRYQDVSYALVIVGYRWEHAHCYLWPCMRSEIAANLNVLEFVKIFVEICKTLGVRWSNRYGVTAP